VGIGRVDTKWLPRAEMDRIVRIGDVEFKFEQTRRELLPEGVSRLSYL
jgi:hypothetical protein